MSRYRELIDYLLSLNRLKDLKTDLSAPLTVAEKLGHPERAFPSVHIAGTNGKGTTAYKIATVLEENGYRVGLFTSPHLETYRERIQINRAMISEQEVVSGLEKILPLFQDPKFFEVTTLLAFDYFAAKEVDIAVIEAGLGGRLDATNIITPILSIITSIAMDHAPVLGNTLEEIARQKSGIIKRGVPVIIGESVSPYDSVTDKGRPLYIVKDDSKAIVRKALNLLPFIIEKRGGIEKNPPCRYEKHGDLILDVAHNPSALIRLFERVKKEYPNRKIYVLLGIAKDKNREEILEVIRKYADKIAFVPTSHPRLYPFKNTTAVKEALETARNEGAIAVATGSFYIMKGLKLLLRARESLGKKGDNRPHDRSQKTERPLCE
ncbi:MAG: Mur ligase family protein [Chlamydiota bacterium]